MYVTAEIRWFFRGNVPPEIQRWFFETAGPPELCAPLETREDFYLRIPRCEHIGVKIRAAADGNLEIKIRDVSIPGERIFQQYVGGLEIWQKVTIRSPIMSRDDSPSSGGTPWIRVPKTRAQRKYAVDAGVVSPAAVEQQLVAGCAMEMTTLALRDSPWWTLGFEAFTGDSDQLTGVLKNAVSYALKDLPVFQLVAGESYGYPFWLAHNA